jgi:hypothetical protein
MSSKPYSAATFDLLNRHLSFNVELLCRTVWR